MPQDVSDWTKQAAISNNPILLTTLTMAAGATASGTVALPVGTSAVGYEVWYTFPNNPPSSLLIIGHQTQNTYIVANNVQIASGNEGVAGAPVGPSDTSIDYAITAQASLAAKVDVVAWTGNIVNLVATNGPIHAVVDSGQAGLWQAAQFTATFSSVVLAGGASATIQSGVPGTIIYGMSGQATAHTVSQLCGAQLVGATINRTLGIGVSANDATGPRMPCINGNFYGKPLAVSDGLALLNFGTLSTTYTGYVNLNQA